MFHATALGRAPSHAWMRLPASWRRRLPRQTNQKPTNRSPFAALVLLAASLASSSVMAQEQRLVISPGRAGTAALVHRANTSPLLITRDGGGVVSTYMARVDTARASGQKVEIRGECRSACTLYLGSGNVCVSRQARLAFHGPSDRGRRLDTETFETWSYRMASYYPEPVRSWFLREGRHHYSPGDTVKMTGSQLIRMGVPEC